MHKKVFYEGFPYDNGIYCFEVNHVDKGALLNTKVLAIPEIQSRGVANYVTSIRWLLKHAACNQTNIICIGDLNSIICVNVSMFRLWTDYLTKLYLTKN